MKTAAEYFKETQKELKGSERFEKRFSYYDLLGFANLYMIDYIDNKLQENENKN